MADPQMPTKFPENAYRELKPGEKYVPMVPPDVTVPELTPRMFIFGLIMNVVFSIAATFLALKAGQGIETAIPISILAVGLSGFIIKAGGRASSILENVYALAISTTSGYVVGGACFTMPAIYILNLKTNLGMSDLSLFLQITLVPFLGAILGVIFLIPFRRYFVKEMHGKLPFPEATATNEILVTGASGSTTQAWILIYSFILSFIYTFLATGLKLFSDVFTTGKAELTAFGSEAVHKVETLAFGDTGLFATLTEKVKAVFSMGAGAYYLGLGFIIGLRYASIICAGSLLSVLVITPLLGRLDFDTLQLVSPSFEAKEGRMEAEPRFTLPLGEEALLNEIATVSKEPEGEETAEAKAAREARKKELLGQLAARFEEHRYTVYEPTKAKLAAREDGRVWDVVDNRRAWVIRATDTGLAVHALEPTAQGVWFQIPRIMGIGAIFTAGLLSILKMGKVIVTALRQAFGGLFKSKAAPAAQDRTDEDLGYGVMMILGILVIIVMAIYFRYVVLAGMENAGFLTFVSVIAALVMAFLFTTVSAWAIAMISVTPVSGMTVTTIIITAVLLAAAGLGKGDQAMLAVLLVGGVVCTALSMAGGLVTNFKLGYWLGASPKRIAWNALAGSLVSAIFVCGTIMVLNIEPGYTPDRADPLPAPQANMMAGALQSFLGTGEVPWLLYGLGVIMALTVELVGISALAFGLGMYLPMYINTPILIGAFVAYLVKKSSKDEKLSKARSNKGILIASGLIAGGAIMEVLVSFTGAVDKLLPWKMLRPLADGGEQFVGKIIPFLDCSGRMIDAGVDPQGLARTENWVGLLLFLALCVFVYFDCRRAKPELGEGELA